MKLNVKALAFAFALVWAGAIFVAGLVNLIWPGYGEAFLRMVSSVYPGYRLVAPPFCRCSWGRFMAFWMALLGVWSWAGFIIYFPVTVRRLE